MHVKMVGKQRGRAINEVLKHTKIKPHQFYIYMHALQWGFGFKPEKKEAIESA